MAKPSTDDFLAHYGVKGMKWGRRKAEARAAEISTLNDAGFSVESSNDANRAHINRARTRLGGTDALSTRDLQELVTRMNLEQQYERLNPAPKNAGLEFAKKIGGQMAQREIEALMKGKKGPMVQLAEAIITKKK